MTGAEDRVAARRPPGTHVDREGAAKVSYDRPEADRVAQHWTVSRGCPMFVYRCAQRPEHYHLTKRVPDLVPSR